MKSATPARARLCLVRNILWAKPKNNNFTQGKALREHEGLERADRPQRNLTHTLPCLRPGDHRNFIRLFARFCLHCHS